MSAKFCPACGDVINVFTTGFDNGQQLMRHYECGCGYHTWHSEYREALTQEYIDRLYRMKQNISLARERLHLN